MDISKLVSEGDVVVSVNTSSVKAAEEDHKTFERLRNAQIRHNSPAVEIRIFEFDREKGGYRVELRCDDGSSEKGFLTQSSLPDLGKRLHPESGKALFGWLFGDANLAAYWAKLRGRYPERRIRLNIDLDADLHKIPWEVLRDPFGDAGTAALAEQESTPFSRYREGRSPGPILDRPIRVLVAIADPGNLEEDWNLFQINRDEEWSAFQESLQGIGAGSFELERLEGHCTLEAIEKQLRTKPGYHILHFTGHGGSRDGEAFLYLADRDNKARCVSDSAVQAMMRNLLGDGASDNPLSLVFLASCETACLSGWNGLAPKLLESGVPTVVAMHGKVPVRTARQFGRVFYQELLANGEVDRACNRARATLRTTENPGSEIPVLFSRLLDGLLFAEPDRQVNLDDLHGFLVCNFDATALERLSNDLGVKLDASSGDVASEARALVRGFEAERRLDVLVAEAMSRARNDPQPIRRVSLSEELRELLSKRNSARRQLNKLSQVEQAIEAERIEEGAAGDVIVKLQGVLQRIRTAGANLDASDLPGVGERVGRFLGRDGNSEVYKLAVAAPMIPLILTSKEVANLTRSDVRKLKRAWEALAQPPLWRRSRALLPALAAVALLALCAAEYGWRRPWHIWPADLLESSDTWSDNFRDSKSGKWQCGTPPGSCEPYLKEGELRLPKGVIAMPGSELALYDFGARFRFVLTESTSRVSWYFRRYSHRKLFAGSPSGYNRFTLTRRATNGKTSVHVAGFWCEAEDCRAIANEKSKNTFTELACGIEQASDFSVDAAVAGQHIYFTITVNRVSGSDASATAPCSFSDSLAPEFWDERWLPRAPFGNLALGDADGNVRFVQEVTLYPVREALRVLRPEQ